MSKITVANYTRVQNILYDIRCSLPFIYIVLIFKKLHEDLKKKLMFLVVPGLSWGTQDLWSSLCHARHFSCSMWDLVLLPGIEPWPPVLGAQSLSHWTTREVPPEVSFRICMCAKSLQSCLTLCDPMDCYPPGSSVHGILQARVLERGAISVSIGLR